MKRANEDSIHADQNSFGDQHEQQPQQQKRKVTDNEFSHDDSDTIDSFSGNVQDLSAIQSDSGPEYSRREDNDSDPIISFRSDGDTFHDVTHNHEPDVSYDEENILEGLDNWRPSPPALSPSPPLHAEPDPLPLRQRMVSTPAPPPLHESSRDAHLSLLGGPLEPSAKPWEFTFKGEPSSPTAKRKRHKNSVSLKPDGLAQRALDCITRSEEAGHDWEREIRADMARHGSTIRAFHGRPSVELHRIMEAWSDSTERVWAHCLPVSPEEMSQIRLEESAPSTQVDDEERIDEVFSQPVGLPPHIPNDEDREELFLFSFAFMRRPTAQALEQFKLRDTCVAVWKPWYVVDGINIAERFMADSIY